MESAVNEGSKGTPGSILSEARLWVRANKLELQRMIMAFAILGYVMHLYVVYVSTIGVGKADNKQKDRKTRLFAILSAVGLLEVLGRYVTDTAIPDFPLVAGITGILLSIVNVFARCCSK